MHTITDKKGHQTTAAAGSGALYDPISMDNPNGWPQELRKRGWNNMKEMQYRGRCKAAQLAGEPIPPRFEEGGRQAPVRMPHRNAMALMRQQQEKRKAMAAVAAKTQTDLSDDDGRADEEVAIARSLPSADLDADGLLSEDDDGSAQDGDRDWLLRTFGLFKAISAMTTLAEEDVEEDTEAEGLPTEIETEEAESAQVRDVVKKTEASEAGKAPKPVPAPFVESVPQAHSAPVISGARSKNGYPIESFGPYGPAIQKIAEVIQVAPSMAGLSLIGGISPLGQSQINVSHRSHDKGMPVTINVLCVAESGERKSSVLRPIIDPIMRGLHLAGDCRTGMVTNDMTVDGLLKGLIQRCPSQYILAPEAVTVLGSHAMSEDARGRFFGTVSGLYSDEALSRTRADGHISAEHRRLAVTLFGQPVVVREFLGSPLVMQQGTANRFLFDWPQSLRGTRFYNEDELDCDPAYRALAERLQTLASAPWAICEQTGGIDPRVVRLSCQAKALWVDFYNHLESQIGEGERFEDYAGYVSRFPEQVLRLAALLGLLDDIEVGQIDADVMERALALGRYYLRSALRLFVKMGAEN